MLSLVNHSCHDKEEYGDVRNRNDHLLVSAKEGTVGTKSRSDSILAYQSQRSKDAEKRKTFPTNGGEEGDDRHHVGPSREMRELFNRVGACVKATAEIDQNKSSENQIEPFHPRRGLDE